MVPQQLYTTEQLRSLEQQAMRVLGLSELTLMQRAAQAAWGHINALFPIAVRRFGVHIVCGAGKNAGDGYLLAALAQQCHVPVRVTALYPPGELKGDAALAWMACAQAGVVIDNEPDLITEGAVVVDALLGIGLNRALDGEYLRTIERINVAHNRVVALDIPSGLQADTGVPLPAAILADVTITFVGVKQGLLTGIGTEYCGKLIFCDLGIVDTGAQERHPQVRVIQGESLVAHLRPRSRHAHKGCHGHLLVVGGDQGMAGAAIMAAEAALHTGCGSVTLATRLAHVPAAVARRPEIMAHAVEQAADVTPLLAGKTAVVIGPGLGRSAWSEALFHRIWQTPLPLLVDADGLYCLSTMQLKPRSHPLIITPHSGEAARLLQCGSKTIENDRFAAVRQLQQRYQATVVLKGAGSLVASDQNTTWLCCAGNPGMAVGGMGDILSGIIGALLLSLDGSLAACLGVWLHARAGDRLVQQQGERGLLAVDMLKTVRSLINHRSDCSC